LSAPQVWQIRSAHDGDIDACVALVVEHNGGEPDEWRRRFRARLAVAESAIHVAVIDDVVVAYGRIAHLVGGGVTADPALPTGFYLTGIVVAPSARRQGIGDALCRSRIEWARDRAPEICFFTNVRNDASRLLHRGAGFEEVREFASPDLDGGRGVLGRLATPQHHTVLSPRSV
jgi:ribosomal protein S18 acetylase RimI-like enzyme